jgi:CDP-paratose 2-epimerase
MLERLGDNRLELVAMDVRDAEGVQTVVKDVDAIFHLAAQVAVTTSVSDPVMDFEVNAAGTLSVLEAARASARRPVLVYASTNKVYGSLDHEAVERRETRYRLSGLPLGIPETQQLDFHSPYGCSKGAADQYVLDYARIYGLRTVVFRQSCIYGPWQRGNEDQGWVAHFVAKALGGEEICLYGDGLQVRDVLFIEDLLEAYQRALESADAVAGRPYNIGGGPMHTTSLLEFVDLLGELLGTPIDVRFSEWRPGDQRVYVSDVRRAAEDLGWEPRTPLRDGVEQLLSWLSKSTGVV